jgi:hypothetical protein
MAIPMPLDTRRALLGALIDDAGLFPPASLPMEHAAVAHREAASGRHGWILGRFLCPASRLRELGEVLARLPAGPPFDLSVILDAPGRGPWRESVERDLDLVRRFSGWAGPAASVRLVEVRLPLPPPGGGRAVAADELVRGLVEEINASNLAGPIVPFLEIPHGADWNERVRETLSAIADERQSMSPSDGTSGAPGAKIRCGGQEPDALPSPEDVAVFVAQCCRLSVPFKATAGLHHPFRHVDASTGIVRHGFLNVAGAAVLAHAHGLHEIDIARLLGDQDPDHFSLIAEGFGWQDLWADEGAIAEARHAVFVAYGSCSFSEPVDDLIGLGILPLEA